MKRALLVFCPLGLALVVLVHYVAQGKEPAAPAHTMAPPPPTVDQLLNRLTELKAQKSDLERQERQTVAAVKETLRLQKEKARRLGID